MWSMCLLLCSPGPVPARCISVLYKVQRRVQKRHLQGQITPTPTASQVPLVPKSHPQWAGKREQPSAPEYSEPQVFEEFDDTTKYMSFDQYKNSRTFEDYYPGLFKAPHKVGECGLYSGISLIWNTEGRDTSWSFIRFIAWHPSLAIVRRTAGRQWQTQHVGGDCLDQTKNEVVPTIGKKCWNLCGSGFRRGWGEAVVRTLFFRRPR